MSTRPIPQASRPVRIAGTDGAIDHDAAQRAIDSLHGRLTSIESGFRGLGSSVDTMSVGGRLLGVQRLPLTNATPLSGIYVPTKGTTRVSVRMVGGGGGGGGVGGAGTGVAAGGGGNSGVYIEFHVISASALTGGPFSIGAGGAGGASTPAAGTHGGTSSIVINGVTHFAEGGTGGTGASPVPISITGPGIQDGFADPNADFAMYGEGGLGMAWNTSLAVAGRGGSTPIGFGGYAHADVNVGQPGFQGGGGSGAVCITAGAQVGGAGGNGLIIIYEFE